MATDAIPVIDLGEFTQSELLKLATSSSASFDLLSLSSFVPKLDPFIFNESTGTHKQTFSPSTNPNPNSVVIPRRRGRPRLHPSSSSLDPSSSSADENIVILSHIRCLFDVGPTDRDLETRNWRGEVVDLVGLGKEEDLYGEEMRRRTQGLTTAEQILGYMTGIDGEWGSRRRKRKMVDADVFGDLLPKGWKITLGLKRKDGMVSLDCRDYIRYIFS